MPHYSQSPAETPARIAPSFPVDRILLIACTIVLGLTVLYPTLRLMWEAAQSWQWDAVTSGSGLRATRNTLGLSFFTVGTAGFFGTGLALALHKYQFPGRGLLAALAYLPFVLPPLVGVLSFYYLIGPGGMLPRFVTEVLGGPKFALTGPVGILVIHTYAFYVFFYAMASAALAAMDHALIEAARTLGATPWRTFTRVTLPQLRPALLGASLLTFMSSAASFSAPYFFGGDFPMLSVKIYEEKMQQNNPAAVTLTVVLAAVALCGLLLFRSTKTSVSGGSKGVRRPFRSPMGKALAGTGAWACMAVLMAPYATIAWLSLVDHRAWHEAIVPTAFTLDNYVSLFSRSGTLRPILNSCWMSAVAALAALAVGVPCAYLAARRRPGGRWVNLLVMIPWALPGTVIAVNLIVAFNDPWLPLYDTVALLPLAYFVRNVPLLTRMAAAAIEPFDATLIEAGRTLGAPPLYCMRRIAVPLLLPSLAAAAALVFAMGLGEFVASILLYLPANLPISIQINMEWRGAGVGVAFAYSMLLVVLVTAAFIVSRRVGQRAL